MRLSRRGDESEIRWGVRKEARGVNHLFNWWEAAERSLTVGMAKSDSGAHFKGVPLGLVQCY